MGHVLCIDVGSTSVRAALYHLRSGRRASGFGVGNYAPVSAARSQRTTSSVDAALRQALRGVGDLSRVTCLSHGSMSPSLVCIGPADSPVLAHDDRRSIEQARRLDASGGEAMVDHVGNQPVPGGISCTSLAWLLRHGPTDLLRRTKAVGHLSTWLTHALTSELAMDYSHAGFTGLMDVRERRWSDRAVKWVGVDPSWLPRLMDAADKAGRVTASAARRYGLPQGAAVLPGVIDTTAAILCAEVKAGAVIHSIGSTDVVAMVVDEPHPSRQWLTRPVGTARLGGFPYVSVVTLAAGGTTLRWLHQTLFSELSAGAFMGRVRGVMRGLIAGAADTRGVTFEPHLAGSRLSVEQPTAAFTGLTVRTTRDDLLTAALCAYRSQTTEALRRLSTLHRPRARVLVTGGASALAALLHADWPKQLRYDTIPDANLRGLATLAGLADL